MEFRKIKSLKFLYEISEDGRIFRNIKSKKQLRLTKNNRNYWLAHGNINGIRFTKTVHSLVAECWLGDKPNNYEIDHIDHNLNNNHYTNLRYVIHSENNLNRVMPLTQPVLISYNNNEIYFNTSQKAAKYISEQLNKSYSSIRWKLHKRRKYILGYKIQYIHNNFAETGNSCFTEQGTVQINKDVN